VRALVLTTSNLRTKFKLPTAELHSFQRHPKILKRLRDPDNAHFRVLPRLILAKTYTYILNLKTLASSFQRYQGRTET